MLRKVLVYQEYYSCCHCDHDDICSIVLAKRVPFTAILTRTATIALAMSTDIVA